MNTREFIEKITKLPKTNDKSSITIFPQPNVNAGCGSNGVRPPRQVKNPHLVRYDDESMSSEERSAYYSNESSLDDAQISCNILEAYGGEVPSNKAIEDHFKTKQKITSEGPKSRVDQWLYAFEHNSRQNPLAEPFPFIINSCYSTKRNGSSSRKSKSKKQKRDDCEKHAQEVFSKNILMRHILLEKQLESMSLESSSSSTSGKDHDSDCTRNSCEFVEMPDDPDVLLRPGMMGKGILEGRPIDDGYRFAHRGVKETITPRRYLMDHVDDDEFIFKKKL